MMNHTCMSRVYAMTPMLLMVTAVLSAQPWWLSAQATDRTYSGPWKSVGKYENTYSLCNSMCFLDGTVLDMQCNIVKLCHTFHEFSITGRIWIGGPEEYIASCLAPESRDQFQSRSLGGPSFRRVDHQTDHQRERNAASSSSSSSSSSATDCF